MEGLDRKIVNPIEHSKANSWEKRPQLANPLLNHLLNHPNIESAGPLKDIILQLCANPDDFSILLPSTRFFVTHIDRKSKRPYSEVCKDLNFVLSHIVRINVMKEPRIRTHKEFTTLNNIKVKINSNTISTVANYTPIIDVKITGQEFICGFSDYIPIGTCFHIVHITECMYNGYDSIETGTDLLINENVITSLKLDSSKEITYNRKENVPFQIMLADAPLLSIVDDRFKTLFKEYTFKKCKSLEEIDNDFTIMMKRGSAMLNTLDSDTFNTLLSKYTPEQLTESVYDYLEENVHENFWQKFVQLSQNEEDQRLKKAYERLKWLSLTQVGLPNEILSNRSTLNEYLKKATAAVRQFKRLQTAHSSSSKCKIISSTIDILSMNTTMDADTLIALLIFVISFSRVDNLNNHILYAKKYAYSHNRIETGFLGYSISSIEVAIKYFQNQEQLDRLVDFSEKNEMLWTLLGAVKNTDNGEDEPVFERIETLLEPFNYDGACLPHYHFIRSISLVGESCLIYALRQKNPELMNVMLQYEHIFTLDDILEDVNIEGSNILSLALELDHPCTEILANIILNATVDEIEKYVNHHDINGRTVGHFLYRCFNLISQLGPFIQWNKKDKLGNTPLMVYIRAYDHPKYVEIIRETFRTVKCWYLKTQMKFNHREHTDSKKNSLMHMIRDANVLKLFLDTFDELEMNCFNDANQTPVSVAVRYNRYDIVSVLLSDPRVCLGIVDPKMFMSPLDYVKLERWGESINREIAKMLEAKFIIMEYGEDFEIACVRARFEPDYGLCCYFRILNRKNDIDLVLVPFDSVVKILKLLKKENPSIPFDFSKPELWFPKHCYVSMKGNINSSNKLRINSLINNINLLVQSLFKNGTLENTESLQTFLLNSQRDNLKVQPLDERQVLKNIFIKDFEHRKSIFTNNIIFQRTIVRDDDIASYEGFIDYTISDLEKYLKVLRLLYRKCALLDVLSENLDLMKTNTPLVCDNFTKYKEICVENSSNIFIDKLRLLYATAVDLFKNAHDMKSVRINRWYKLINDLKMIRKELTRVTKVDNLETHNVENDKSRDREMILSKIFVQIDLLTGENRDPEEIELFRNDLLQTVYKEKYCDQPSTVLERKGLEELLNFGETGIGTWFTEKRKTVYIKKLVNGFLRHRIELVELFIDLRKSYEQLAVFVSKFYEFRGDIFKDAFKYYSRNKLGELNRELLAWELSFLHP